MSKFNWSDDDVNFINIWWPHFGTEWVASELSQTKLRVKAKVDKLQLKMLPKTQRLCITCRTNFQYIDDNPNRRTNKTCKVCELRHRKDTRKKYPEYELAYKRRQYNKRRQDKSWEELFNDIARTLRYRNKKLHSCSEEITAQELRAKYDSQAGKCKYTGRTLEKPITNDGIKNPNVLSIDRIDSTGGYTIDNIALVCWYANVAKHEYDLDDFIKLCRDVVATLET